MFVGLALLCVGLIGLYLQDRIRSDVEALWLAVQPRAQMYTQQVGLLPFSPLLSLFLHPPLLSPDLNSVSLTQLHGDLPYLCQVAEWFGLHDGVSEPPYKPVRSDGSFSEDEIGTPEVRK